jgi:hypothetical protein
VTERRVDELRDELRARGYLDARVDRFVLGGAAARARPIGVAIAASWRIGLLAAVLLGPAAAIGLRSRAPELVTSAADAVVLSIYLGVLFWIAGTVLAGLGVLAGAALARRLATGTRAPQRIRQAAGMAGLGVGLACLVYLTLWWRTATGLTASSLAASLTVISLAVAISLLLGHAVAVTVLACVARLGLTPASQRRLPMSSVKTMVPLGAAAMAGALTLLVAAGPAQGPSQEPPRLTVVPTGLRVFVIAIDGVDQATLERMRVAGRIPAVSRVLDGSVALLPPIDDRDPARLWTTIATGQLPERHGIRALESRRVAGLEGRLRTDSPGWALLAGATDVVRLTQPAIASGRERLIPTFWEVAARTGFRTAVVHWWATWPADAESGIVLSDRAILRLEHPGALDAEIAPSSLYDSLRQTWPERRSRAAARAAALSTADLSADIAGVLRRSAELDASIVGLAQATDLASLDLLAVYLPGLDIAQSTLLGAASSGLAASAAAERIAALERYYVFLDGLVADLLAATPIQHRLDVLLMEPGRVGSPVPGSFAMAGASVSRIRRSATRTVIAPTVLHALGVPVALDMAGLAVADMFDQAFNHVRPVRTVPTYGSRGPLTRTQTGQALDREMIERMRSLGYVR